MNSDFFLAEADPWRDEAWQIMKKRSDVIFFLLTKRPERVAACLPADWGMGWENIFFNVTVENQKRAESRMDWLMKLPFQHKGVMCAPLIGPVDLSPWLASGQIEQVICGGENYDGARPCDYRWVQDLGAQCRRAGVTFNFIETGSVFVKDGKTYPCRPSACKVKWRGNPDSASAAGRRSFIWKTNMVRSRLNGCISLILGRIASAAADS